MSRPSDSGNEEEFAYSSSGSEGEGTWEGERPTGKSVLNVFKGYHVPGKYKPSMDASIVQSIDQESNDDQDTEQSEDSTVSRSETNRLSVKNRISMFEAITEPSVVACMPDSMQQRHSVSEDCSIIGATMTPETNESGNKGSRPPVPPKPSKSLVVSESITPTLTEDTIETKATILSVDSDDEQPPKMVFKNDFTKSLFADAPPPDVVEQPLQSDIPMESFVILSKEDELFQSGIVSTTNTDEGTDVDKEFLGVKLESDVDMRDEANIQESVDRSKLNDSEFDEDITAVDFGSVQMTDDTVNVRTDDMDEKEAGSEKNSITEIISQVQSDKDGVNSEGVIQLTEKEVSVPPVADSKDEQVKSMETAELVSHVIDTTEEKTDNTEKEIELGEPPVSSVTPDPDETKQTSEMGTNELQTDPPDETKQTFESKENGMGTNELQRDPDEIKQTFERKENEMGINEMQTDPDEIKQTFESKENEMGSNELQTEIQDTGEAEESADSSDDDSFKDCNEGDDIEMFQSMQPLEPFEEKGDIDSDDNKVDDVSEETPKTNAATEFDEIFPSIEIIDSGTIIQPQQAFSSMSSSVDSSDMPWSIIPQTIDENIKEGKEGISSQSSGNFSILSKSDSDENIQIVENSQIVDNSQIVEETIAVPDQCPSMERSTPLSSEGVCFNQSLPVDDDEVKEMRPSHLKETKEVKPTGRFKETPKQEEIGTAAQKPPPVVRPTTFQGYIVKSGVTDISTYDGEQKNHLYCAFEDNQTPPPPPPPKSQAVLEELKSLASQRANTPTPDDTKPFPVEQVRVDQSEESETQADIMTTSVEYGSYSNYTYTQGYPPAAGYDANAYQGQYGMQAGQYDPQLFWQPYPGQQPFTPNAHYQAPSLPPEYYPYQYYPPYAQAYPNSQQFNSSNTSDQPHIPAQELEKVPTGQSNASVHAPEFVGEASKLTSDYKNAPSKQKGKESFKPKKSQSPRKTKDTSKQGQHRTPTETTSKPQAKHAHDSKQHQKHVPKRNPTKQAPKPEHRKSSAGKQEKAVTDARKECTPIKVEKDTTKYCIFAKGIDKTASEEHLINLFEVCMGNTADYIQDSMVFNFSKTCAVFSVKGKPDMENMKTNMAKKNLSFQPELHLLDTTPMIAISCNGAVAVGMLELYFESDRNGGGDVEGTPYETDDGNCTIVTFSDAEVVERVCAKKDHILNGQSLQVSPFYKCELGELYDAKLHKFSLPEPIVLTLSTVKTQLLKKECCSKLLENLKAHFCQCDLSETTLTLTCCLSPITPNVKELKRSWDGDVVNLVNHFFENNTDNHKMDFNDKIVTNVVEHCTTFSKHPDVVVLCDESKCLVEVFGLRASTSSVFEDIEGNVKQWERQLTRTTERITYSFLHLKLMEKLGFISRLKEKPEFDVRVGDDFVDLEGQPDDITHAKLELHKGKDKMKVFKYEHGLSFECAEFVGSKEKVIALIDESFKEKRIEASWKLEGSEFHVVFVKDQEDDYGYANVVDMDSDIVSVFSNILEKFILYERDDKDVFHSAEWTLFITDLTEDHDDFAGFDIDEKKCRLVMHGWHKNVNEMYKRIESFLDKRVLRTILLKRGTIQTRFIQRFNRDVIDDLQNNLKERNGFIAFGEDKETIEIRGNKKDRDMARDKLEKVFTSVIREEHTIEKVSVKDVFQDEKARGKIGEIEQSTRCVIQLPGEQETFQPEPEEDVYAEIGIDQVPGAKAAPGKAAMSSETDSFLANNGTNISIVLGEIGKQKGDVFVVSTSPSLNLKGGQAGRAILHVAGHDLQHKIKEAYPEDIAYGDIADVGGGKMKCDCMYLTALPGWKAADHKAQEVLKKLVQDCLKKASKEKKMSIVFSALGCGQLKYPVEVVAGIMFESAVDFDKNNKKSSLKTVQFVIYPSDEHVKKAFKDELRLRRDGGGKRHVYTMKKDMATIELVVENLAEQKVDVILCSTSSTMDLKHGACLALLKKGGKKLEEECASNYSNTLDDCQIAEISSGDLPCKKLFLTVLPRYAGEESITKLKEMLRTAFKLAETRKYSSLAIPAMGTGNLKYPKEDVCRCMFETFIELGKQEEANKHFTVKFVMHAKDHDLIGIFRRYLESRSKHRKRGERHLQDVKPKNRNIAHSSTDYDTVDHGIRIFGVDLKVFIGDILEHKADAFVTSTGSKLELHGAVAKGLKKRCPQLEEQCQAQLSTFQRDGILVTKCPGLKASKTILVKYVDRPSEWTEQMRKCLEVANHSKIKTVAFPVLGSGAGFSPIKPENIAESLFDALDEFMSDESTDLKIREVHLIVYKTQAERFQPIIDVLRSKAMKATSDLKSGSLGQLKKAGRKFWKKTKELVGVGYLASEEGATAQPRPSPSSSKRNTSTLALYIYSDSSENIQRCKQRLETHLEEALITAYVKQYTAIVCSLTKEEKEELESLPLVVDMKIDEKDGIVVIKGERKLAFEAQSNVREMLMRFEKNRCELEQSQELAKKIEWQYEEEDTIEMKYKFYGNLQSFKMEMAYQRNERFVSFVDNGVEYEIDFNDMVEYAKHDKADLVRVVRKEILKGQQVPLPTEWKAMKDGVNIKLVEIKPDEKQFKDIEARFMTEVKNGQYANSPGHKYDKNSMKVVKIERIQNKALYQQYQAKKSFLQEQKPILPPNMPLERELWHGTNEAAMDSIICHGFNRSYAGDNAGKPWYGQGVYFASDASYSARSWMTGAGVGKKGYVFLVKALTGHLCPGKPGMRVLEPVDKAKDPLVLYDCAVDKLANPMEFVIFSDTQAYPAYILTFSSG
ncbi:protein mono-ADP-ribosyltransferase PARP14-like [Mya arenaria]|uniref:protein mono-ADP-ribosyltransferase PARP14-like n=1 Tax=Mya arenaria TaxID=6604 RepID=UPI0022E81A35|nr:protein mono-ADP-ribosyltransferase PARP14-like [Mya arenaria]XP_052771708.1 protein mono-ADP-ribosyltransferase PARP14-like [Mya arenaria]